MIPLPKIGELTEVNIYNLQYSSKQIAAAVGKSPVVQLSEDRRQTWWIWDIASMSYKDTGVVAYLGDINEAKTSAARAEASATAAREAAKEAAESAAEARKHGSAEGGGGAEPNELEDYSMETGRFVNAGAGWNTYKFREPFDGVPSVVCQALNFQGWVEIKNVTTEGFLYCLRKPNFAAGKAGSVAAGSVTTGQFYTASGTSSSSAHAEHTLVSGVTLPVVTMPTLPTATLTTTANQIEIHYIAIEYGGDR